MRKHDNSTSEKRVHFKKNTEKVVLESDVAFSRSIVNVVGIRGFSLGDFRTKSCNSGTIQHIIFFPNSRRVVSSCVRGSITVWNFDTGEHMKIFLCHFAGNYVWDCKCHIIKWNDDIFLSCGSRGNSSFGTINSFSVSSMALQETIFDGLEGKPVCMEKINDDQFLFCRGRYGESFEILVISYSQKSIVRKLEPRSIIGGSSRILLSKSRPHTFYLNCGEREKYAIQQIDYLTDTIVNRYNDLYTAILSMTMYHHHRRSEILIGTTGGGMVYFFDTSKKQSSESTDKLNVQKYVRRFTVHRNTFTSSSVVSNKYLFLGGSGSIRIYDISVILHHNTIKLIRRGDTITQARNAHVFCEVQSQRIGSNVRMLVGLSVGKLELVEVKGLKIVHDLESEDYNERIQWLLTQFVDEEGEENDLEKITIEICTHLDMNRKNRISVLKSFLF